MKVSPERHNLARLRLFLDLRQKEFAELIGCPRPTLQAIELGHVPFSEELAIRTSVTTGASVSWLLENDLSSPIVSRSGNPYGLEHFVYAQMCLPGRNGFYIGGISPDDHLEDILMAVTRLDGVFEYLALNQGDLKGVAIFQLRQFLSQLEEKYGTYVPADTRASKGPCVHWGRLRAKQILEQTEEPVRTQKLLQYIQRSREVEDGTLAEIRTRIADAKRSEIPKLIEIFRKEAELDDVKGKAVE